MSGSILFWKTKNKLAKVTVQLNSLKNLKKKDMMITWLVKSLEKLKKPKIFTGKNFFSFNLKT